MAKKTKKMQRGGRSEATHMASGQPIQWQSGPTGQRRKADYMSYVAPKVARKQMKRQAAAGGPGRGAVRAAGPGGKAGGAVKKMQGGGMAPAISPKVQLTPRQQMGATIRPQMARLDREMKSRMRGHTPQEYQPGGKGGGPVKKLKGGGTVSYNDLIRSKGW